MSSMIILLSGIVAALGIVFVVDALREEGIEDAVETTSNRVVGVLTGALGAFGAALTVGIEQLPELLIGLLGVGSIIQGIPWQMFLVGALLLWMISETISMRSAGGA